MENKSIVLELERAYDFLNLMLFEGKLGKVSFGVQFRKKISIRWLPEFESIIVGGDILKLEFEEIPVVLLHEMIHVYNFQRKIIDVTTNQYHNKHFLQVALEVGLVVIKHKTQGWALTSTEFPRNVIEKIYVKRPAKDCRKLLNGTFQTIELDCSVFKLGRTEIRERIKLEKPTKTYFLKYQCNCLPPHNSIRSGRRPDGPNALNIQCQNCSSQFECVTDLNVTDTE